MQGVLNDEDEEDSGIWTAWAWENPPMTPGKEYLTTQFWNDGTSLYTKFFTFETSDNKTVEISTAKIIRDIRATVAKDGIVHTLPYYNGTSLKCNLWAQNKTLHLSCDSDVEGTVYVQVWYTK